ncbi:hypothetical protein [Helicobacter canis]|uniref:Lipoprotein n=1 Tax=Helicobacter canis NCTC 12740 TaxID=1357399 RepID=V8CK90_9HELI|nr:hypothetical protein [Helicobacter canis]ETD27818.1 hypothetical protein HMPREF2087_00740 [Helicobacter canis NCTC 12740]
MKTLTHNLMFVFAALFLLSGCASWATYKEAYQTWQGFSSDAKEIKTIVKNYQNHTIASQIKQAGFDDKTAKLLEAVWLCSALIKETSNKQHKTELLDYTKASHLFSYCQLKHTQLKYYDNEVALLSSVSNYKKYEKNTTAEYKLRSNFNYQEIQALYTKLIKDGSK